MRTVKKSLYFDPAGIGVRRLAIPVVSSLHDTAEHATLECLGPFFRGRERIRGCKVGITKNHRRYFYMVYTKYRRTEINYAIMEESGNQGSWKGPLVVMRLDATSATRLVSITSKTHKDLAIQAVARYASLAPSHTCEAYPLTRFTSVMNAKFSTLPYRTVRWPQRLQVADG